MKYIYCLLLGKYKLHAVIVWACFSLEIQLLKSVTMKEWNNIILGRGKLDQLLSTSDSSALCTNASVPI